MDAVREAHALLVAHPRQHRREREGDALERVVAVIQDDDVPRPSEARAVADIEVFTRGSESRHADSVRGMSAVALDVDAVRARFSALQGPVALFDGPGGTQVPDTVIEAIADYLRESNANLGGAFGSPRPPHAPPTH